MRKSQNIVLAIFLQGVAAFNNRNYNHQSILSQSLQREIQENRRQHVTVVSPDSPETFWSLERREDESDGSSISGVSEEEKTTTCDLPPVIQQIADERQNYNMNLGKAMDTLRKDMPEILRKTPDYSIYHKDIQATDPSGVQLTGLDKYKSAYTFFQTFIKFWFSTTRSGLQYRMVYDFCRSSIRISWHVVLVPKFSVLKPIFLDGVSYYNLDTESGKIIEHKIENLMINNNKVAPPYSILSLLQQQQMEGAAVGVPAGAGAGF